MLALVMLRLEPNAPLRERPPTPKQAKKGGRSLYRYYAGYADEFVDAMVKAVAAEGVETLLDPWNGAGTTTSVATANGVSSVGLDANPVAVMVARASLLAADVADSLEPLALEIVDQARLLVDDVDLSNEPMEAWLRPRTALWLRALDRSIYKLLVARDHREQGAVLGLAPVSSLAAFYYVVLFGLIRRFTRPLLGTNPTWIPKSVVPDERTCVYGPTVLREFVDHVSDLAQVVQERKLSYGASCPAEIRRASSHSLPLESNSIDAVVTSPPYCTRIDYVVATLPELAVLGFGDGDIRELRETMIGSPTIHHDGFDSGAFEGRVATRLLKRVGKHPCHGASYYRRFYEQYIGGMWESLKEIDRVSCSGAPVVLVAQDSYFKEVHVDVARLLEEMGSTLGWGTVARHNFKVTTKAAMNGKARPYGRVGKATETVLVMEAA